MIIDIVAHGRTRADADRLVAHLRKTEGQRVGVVTVDGLCADTLEGAVDEMLFLRDASACTVAIHHVSLAPRILLTPLQEKQMCRAVLDALGAQDHGYVLVAHCDKARALPGGACDHYHMVLAHVGPDLRAIDTSWSYPKLEAAARELEATWGEELTPSRHAGTVAGLLEQRGKSELAGRVREGADDVLPRSGMTKASRAYAERAGCHLPTVRHQVREAYERSDGRHAFEAALAEHGLTIASGRAGVFVVRFGNVHLGAIDRLVAKPRNEVAVRLAHGWLRELPAEQPMQVVMARAPEAVIRGSDGSGGAGGRPCIPVPATASPNPDPASDRIVRELRAKMADWPAGWANLVAVLGSQLSEGGEDAIDDVAQALARQSPRRALDRLEAMLTDAWHDMERHDMERHDLDPHMRSPELRVLAAGVAGCLEALMLARDELELHGGCTHSRGVGGIGRGEQEGDDPGGCSQVRPAIEPALVGAACGPSP